MNQILMMTYEQLNLPFVDSDSDIFRALKDVNALVQYRDLKADDSESRIKLDSGKIDARQCELDFAG